MGHAWAASINSIELKAQDEDSVLEISGDSLTGYKKEEKKSPAQLVLTFDNATLADEAKKKLEPAAGNSGVLQISSYPVSGGKARVVIDFSKSPKYSIEDTDQKITVKLSGAPKVAEKKRKETGIEETASTKSKVDTKIADKDALTTIMSSQGEKKFTGSPISLNLKDADVHEVLRMIGDASGFNVVVSPAVTGKITVELDQVPWDQALDVVLTTLKLGAERSDSVLRVMPRDMLIREKQEELDQKRVVADSAPRVTRVFPISYADMTQLQTLLQQFAQSQNTTPGSSVSGGTILVDQTTQSLVVRDTAENVERIRKMIQLLDVQTPQVLIEAKVVEASEDFAKDLEGSITGINHDRVFKAGINGTNASSTAGSAGGGSSSPTHTSSIAMFALGEIGLTANLSYAEKLSKAKVVSSPKLAILSGKSASINQSTSYGYTTTSRASDGTTLTSVATAQANTKLDVSPRVTNDGSVFMKLNLSRDVLNLTNSAAPAVEPRTINTEVIVDSGNTLVIGGVLNIDENSSEEGFPILRKLPLIGWLFGSEVSLKSKRELMFFITPRILNQKKASIGTQDEGPKT